MAAHYIQSARDVVIASLLLALSACGGGGSTAPSTSPALSTTRPVEQSDLQIAQLLYSDSQRTPAAFYKETPPAYVGYVSTAHVKNTDLSASATSPQYEVCTDDWSIALAWSDQAAAAMATSTVVESNATSRYHEFSRVRTGNPPGYVRTRVYRCGYLDRSAVDLRNETGAAGTFNQRPLNAGELQQLVEYLWQFTTYNNYGNVVLKSSGTSSSGSLDHTLVIASIGAGANGCDRIEVDGWTHTVDTQSGALNRSKQTLWEFGARRSAGVVELCNPF